MKKDTNLRVLRKDRDVLKRLAKKERRTLKDTFGVVVKAFVDAQF